MYNTPQELKAMIKTEIIKKVRVNVKVKYIESK